MLPPNLLETQHLRSLKTLRRLHVSSVRHCEVCIQSLKFDIPLVCSTEDFGTIQIEALSTLK
ncbi:ANM_HP_G0101570.mRNA.1.CDS.1 [Saccharomyces cerevisiae]|nr:ANM_HP_G0101570.mRNA.1.CDS.1 [Saccharomyces cerevisiae]CAI6412730.1 ANM_HP_G0101570.mRNA.1.CDS.1 [Saccharomyces cerevisiae]